MIPGAVLRRGRLLAGLVAGAAVATTAVAAATAAAAAADPKPRLALAAGVFDPGGRGRGGADVRVEYRSNRPLRAVRPWVGLEATQRGALYGAGGLYFDVVLGPRLIVTGSGGVGAHRDGDGKDLGHTIQFRTQVELALCRPGGSRLSLALSHLSNASLGDRNPGAQVVSVYYSIPLTRNVSGARAGRFRFPGGSGPAARR